MLRNIPLSICSSLRFPNSLNRRSYHSKVRPIRRDVHFHIAEKEMEPKRYRAEIHRINMKRADRNTFFLYTLRKSKRSMMEACLNTYDCSIFSGLVEGDMNIARMLSQSQPRTLLCPHDDAMAVIKTESLMELQSNSTLLLEFVQNHLLLGKWYQKDLYALVAHGDVAFQNVNEQFLHLSERSDGTIRRDGLEISGARVVRADLPCFNSVLHQIDSVLLPEGWSSR